MCEYQYNIYMRICITKTITLIITETVAEVPSPCSLLLLSLPHAPCCCWAHRIRIAKFALVLPDLATIYILYAYIYIISDILYITI